MENETMKAASATAAMCLTEDEKTRLRQYFLDKMAYLPIGLRMGKYLVTQADWKLVMEVNPSSHRGDDLPVENVSWNECQAFIHRLNEWTGEDFRLPTEEEWEEACLAGSEGDWGNVEEGVEGTLDEMGWYDGNSGDETHPVGQKRPNAWGLHDMHGNVWEWTATSCDGDGETVGDLDNRVGCGGSYCDNAECCSALLRCWVDPVCCHGGFGFRLALSRDRDSPAGNKTGEMRQAAPAERGSDGSGKREASGQEIPTAAERMMRLSEPEKARLKKHFLNKMVRLPTGLRMGKFQVTQADWKLLVSWSPSRHSGDDLPMENVSWDMCQEFINMLNALTGESFRLPTEGEWKEACLAGGEGDWGNVEEGVEGTLDEMGWYAGNSIFDPHPVGQKRPNAWGLHDMHGNVWEWTATSDGDTRVSLGGSFMNHAYYCAVSFRGEFEPGSRFGNLGFRLALSRD